jgi:cytoskeletal protein CcmA (bactofilin family)
MAWGKRETEQGSSASAEIENVLGKTVHVHGDLKAEGAFRIDGTIEGAVESKAGVVIGQSGVVRGPVQGLEVVIAGQVYGNVIAGGHLEILSTGRVEGDIEAQSLRIATGGVFRGTSRMGGQAQEDPGTLAHLSSVK